MGEVCLWRERLGLGQTAEGLPSVLDRDLSYFQCVRHVCIVLHVVGGRFLTREVPLYRGTSLIRKRTPLRPYRRPVPRVLGWS